MTYFESLLSNVRSFLCDDLGALPLPPGIENKRLSILEQIDVASLGPTPSIPTVTPAGSTNNPSLVNNSSTIPPLTTSTLVQRRPLNSVVRLFSSSRKRYSLPASISYPPHIPEDAEPSSPHTDLVPFDGGADYEIPKNIVSATSMPTASALPSSPYRHGHSVIPLHRSPLSRHSLSPPPFESPQQADKPISNGWNPSASTAAHASQDDSALTLPKKSLTIQTRRFSAFMIDPAWTLIGPLHHRYKPNKWARLQLCLLTSGSRLIAYKSTFALTPNLVVFLCGASAIYAGRDSGMDCVIKIAHPTRGTAVLAADQESHALIWIKQINQYAQGITPCETQTLLEQPCSVSSLSHSNGQAASNPLTPIRSVLSTQQRPSNAPDLSSPGPHEPQEDSGFSAPVSSSGSEGNSADGVIVSRPNSASITHTTCIQNSSISPIRTSTTPSHRASYSAATNSLPPSQTFNQDSSIYYPWSSHVSSSIQKGVFGRNTIGGALKTATSRRSSLLSSVRRKVESLGSKRRGRKSLPQPTHVTSPTFLNGLLQRTDSFSDLIEYESNHSATETVPPIAACGCLPGQPSATGFGWAQLETAGRLFGSSDAGPSALARRGSSSTPSRPQSLIIFSPTDTYETETAVSSKYNGPLLDLSTSNKSATLSSKANDLRTIISGDACISIPGCVNWTTRWCCLRQGCLDIYPYTSSTLFSAPTAGHDNHRLWPLFSLSLPPGRVEFGLAGDKQHKAALRLAVPHLSKTVLLFDAADKLDMGAWIRGFIEALGIIPSKSESFHGTPESTRASPDRGTCTYDDPEQNSYSTIQDVARTCDANPTEPLESPTTYLETDLDNLTLYDEVCPNTNSESYTGFRTRWSSPRLPIDKPLLLSHSTVSTGSESTDYYLSTTPSPKKPWAIPPPSRRLLSQPLPPLPSIGPSGAESMTGTMTSSHASSCMTPEDASPLPDKDLEPQLRRLSWATSGQPAHSSCHNSPHPDWVQPSDLKRHSSLGSLTMHGSANVAALRDPQTLPSVDYDPPSVTTCTLGPEEDEEAGAKFPRSESFSVDYSSPMTGNGKVSSWVSQMVPVVNTTSMWPEVIKPVFNGAVNLARRSISCVTGTAPPSLQNPRTAATLPVRSHTVSNPGATAEDEDVKPSSSASYYWSSPSSHTATSSGVALTAGSSAGSASGNTTQPTSMVWSFTPDHEEQTLASREDNHSAGNQIRLTGSYKPDTLPTRRSTIPIAAVPVRRADTVTGVDYVGIRPNLGSSSSTGPSPTNASLMLIATQLEEVQQGTKKLRSRHQTLSFRLSNRLACDGCCSPLEPVNSSESAIKLPIERETMGASMYAPDDEATSSLCARLAAIDMLIQQAESMELYLRQQMSQVMTTCSSESSKTEHVMPLQPVVSAPANCTGSPAKPRRRNRRGRHHPPSRPLQPVNSEPAHLEFPPAPGNHRGGRGGGGGRGYRSRRHHRRGTTATSNRNRHSYWAYSPLNPTSATVAPITITPAV